MSQEYVSESNRKGRIQKFGFETGRMDSELEDLNSKFIQYTYILNGREGGEV